MRISDWSSDVCSSDRHERMLKQVAFVPLSAAQALVVLVAGDGAVENRVIDIPPGLPPSALVEAGNYISHMLGGLTLAEPQAHAGENFLDLVERLAAEVGRAQHLGLGLLNQIADVDDVVVLQAIGRTDGQ